MDRYFLGKIKDAHSLIVREDLSAHRGRKVLVEVPSKNKLRTFKQNGYYFGVVVKMINSALDRSRLELDETHQDLADMFLAYDKITANGKKRHYRQSTTNLDWREFGDYIEKCRKWAGEFLELEIPDPDTEYQWKNL